MAVYEPQVFDQDNPLVSVLVYNYNYGRYLKECLDSIAAQSYCNIEIIFSDNASTDDSWDIAQQFAEKHSGLMTLTKNRKNMGVDANFRNCYMNIRGKYYINMCSDDVLAPGYVQKCVEVLEQNSQLGFVMVHRSIIDQHSQLTDEAPFYNRSCIINGHEQAAVYMMAAVNPSVSQIMYHKTRAETKMVKGSLVNRWYGTRILDFNICMEYPIAYICEPLLLHRLHGANDSLAAADKLLEVIGPYILCHQFAETAENIGLKNVVERLPSALKKLASLAVRYSIRALLAGDKVQGKKYFNLAYVMDDDIENDQVYQELSPYWSLSEANQKTLLVQIQQYTNVLARQVSYDPPEGSKPLSLHSDDYLRQVLP